MSIDWSKAPEGATHWQPENSKLLGAWFKVRDGSHFFKMEGQKNWLEYDGQLGDIGVLIERPAGWTGEGTPPAGTICEIETICRAWVKVIVVAVTDYRIYCEEFDADEPREYTPVKQYARFRPIRTPEQIKADERSKAIQEMFDVVVGKLGSNGLYLPESCGVLAVMSGALYDANYRKVTP